MNKILEVRKKELKQNPPSNFGDFHAIVSKSMPDVTRYPQMYDLCYDLIKLSWDTAQRTVDKQK